VVVQMLAAVARDGCGCGGRGGAVDGPGAGFGVCAGTGAPASAASRSESAMSGHRDGIVLLRYHAEAALKSARALAMLRDREVNR
jgi:hypothetical protein